MRMPACRAHGLAVTLKAHVVNEVVRQLFGHVGDVLQRECTRRPSNIFSQILSYDIGLDVVEGAGRGRQHIVGGLRLKLQYKKQR